MAKSKKPRKKYRPRPVINPLAVIHGARMADEAYGSDLLVSRIKTADAILRLMQGDATEETINYLAMACNTSLALVETAGIGADWLEHLISGSDALRSVWDRSKGTGRFVCTGPELNDIRAALELHEEQLKVCTVKQLTTAIALGEARSSEPQAGAA